MTNKKLAYRVGEAAQLLSISRASAYELINRGELPAVKIGKSWRVPHDALKKVLAEADKTNALTPRSDEEPH